MDSLYALESARHALVTLHGLTATDQPHAYEAALSDGCDPDGARKSQGDVSWLIDETKVIAQIDAALAALRAARAPRMMQGTPE